MTYVHRSSSGIALCGHPDNLAAMSGRNCYRCQHRDQKRAMRTLNIVGRQLAH
jgi:hypothetical protein